MIVDKGEIYLRRSSNLYLVRDLMRFGVCFMAFGQISLFNGFGKKSISLQWFFLMACELSHSKKPPLHHELLQLSSDDSRAWIRDPVDMGTLGRRTVERRF